LFFCILVNGAPKKRRYKAMVKKEEYEDYFILTIKYNEYGLLAEQQMDLIAMLIMEYPEMELAELDTILAEFGKFHKNYYK
jgi:hypothetical protein